MTKKIVRMFFASPMRMRLVAELTPHDVIDFHVRFLFVLFFFL